jgi:hypothetical protein
MRAKTPIELAKFCLFAAAGIAAASPALAGVVDVVSPSAPAERWAVGPPHANPPPSR